LAFKLYVWRTLQYPRKDRFGPCDLRGIVVSMRLGVSPRVLGEVSPEACGGKRSARALKSPGLGDEGLPILEEPLPTYPPPRLAFR